MRVNMDETFARLRTAPQAYCARCIVHGFPEPPLPSARGHHRDRRQLSCDGSVVAPVREFGYQTRAAQFHTLYLLD
jgi:hypothetical protein